MLVAVVQSRANPLDFVKNPSHVIRIPAGRFAAPKEVAELVFDLSQKHTYLTSQIIGFDGGLEAPPVPHMEEILMIFPSFAETIAGIAEKRGLTLRTKTVFITGSSRGIGRACALRFAAAGYHVFINCKKSGIAARQQ